MLRLVVTLFAVRHLKLKFANELQAHHHLRESQAFGEHARLFVIPCNGSQFRGPSGLGYLNTGKKRPPVRSEHFPS